MMRSSLILIVSLVMGADGVLAETGPGAWHPKSEFLAALVRAVPRILKSQDAAAGTFGTGIWIPPDQSVIYPLAAAWSEKEQGNRYYHDPKLLEAIMKGGDLLAKAQ